MRIVLTNNARFSPYTFNEMLKPLAMATDAYNEVQSNISELGAKADLMRMYADESPDSKASKMYNTYAKDLDRQAQLLAKNGLTPMSRQALLNMRRRYSSEITPIETAVKRREALADEQRKARLSDSSLMFDTDYSRTPVDYLLDNPSASYSSISGDALTKRASQMASSLTKTMQGDPRYESILNGQYFQQMQRMGYTPSQIMDTILNDENAPDELRQIVETVYNEAGLDRYSRDIQERARGYINAGLYDAIGTVRYDAMDNKDYVSPLEWGRYNMQKEEHQWRKQALDEERLGVEYPNGDRVKSIGAGRVLVAHPDGRYEIMTSAAGGSDEKLTPSMAAKRATFTALDYKKKNFEGTVRAYNKFNVGQAKLIPFSDLTTNAQRKLREDLAEYGYTPDDVDIWWDHDDGFWDADHYRVVLKGTDIYGMSPIKAEENNMRQKAEAASNGEKVGNTYDQEGLND